MNPFGVEALSAIAGAAVAAGSVITLLCIPPSLAGLLVRFRRSRGEERQQLRWLAYVVGTFTALVVLQIAIGMMPGDTPLLRFASDTLFLLSFALLGLGVPATTGIAVLRYRLYDLDLVVKKTVVFVVLVVLLMTVSLGLLLALSSPLTDLAPDETQAVDHGPARRAVGVAALARGPADRRPHRLRRSGDPVRDPERVLRARRRDLFDRRRPPPDGTPPRRGDRRGGGSRVAPGGRHLPSRRELARRRSDPVAGADLGRRPACARGTRGRRSASRGSPRRVERRDAGQRPDATVEGTDRARPRRAGRAGPAERPPDRGAPRVEAPDRRRAGRAREEARAEHPRRGAAAARRARGEGAPRRHARDQGRRADGGHARGDPDRPAGGPRRSPRSRAWHLSAAVGRQGTRGGADGPGPESLDPRRASSRTGSGATHKRSSPPSTSRASRRSTT